MNKKAKASNKGAITDAQSVSKVSTSDTPLLQRDGDSSQCEHANVIPDITGNLWTHPGSPSTQPGYPWDNPYNLKPYQDYEPYRHIKTGTTTTNGLYINSSTIIPSKEYPTAKITKRKARLKVHDGSIVYLDKGTPFEIEIHNPSKYDIYYKITMDDRDIPVIGYCIIKSNERQFVELDVDTLRPFIYQLSSDLNIKVTFYTDFMNFMTIGTTVSFNNYPSFTTTGNLSITTSNSISFSTTGNVGISTSNSPTSILHIKQTHYGYTYLDIPNMREVKDSIDLYLYRNGLYNVKDKTDIGMGGFKTFTFIKPTISSDLLPNMKKSTSVKFTDKVVKKIEKYIETIGNRFYIIQVEDYLEVIKNESSPEVDITQEYRFNEVVDININSIKLGSNIHNFDDSIISQASTIEEVCAESTIYLKVDFGEDKHRVNDILTQTQYRDGELISSKYLLISGYNNGQTESKPVWVKYIGISHIDGCPIFEVLHNNEVDIYKFYKFEVYTDAFSTYSFISTHDTVVKSITTDVGCHLPRYTHTTLPDLSFEGYFKKDGKTIIVFSSPFKSDKLVDITDTISDYIKYVHHNDGIKYNLTTVDVTIKNSDTKSIDKEDLVKREKKREKLYKMLDYNRLISELSREFVSFRKHEKEFQPGMVTERATKNIKAILDGDISIDKEEELMFLRDILKQFNNHILTEGYDAKVYIIDTFIEIVKTIEEL